MMPLNPTLHPAYIDLLEGRRPVPPDVRERLSALLAHRNTAPETELDAIDRRIVALAYRYAIDPADIARRMIATWHLPPRVLSINQAALVIAAIGEAGWPIHGNGAPDYPDRHDWPDFDAAPVRGPVRDKVIWDAAHYWAELASQDHMHVSFGGNCPRPVQYDMTACIGPDRKSALTFGPTSAASLERRYTRRHTRMMLRVRRQVEG